MGRFDTLNNETKDLVECILPALAQSFEITDCKEIIPEDIRMRAWDCERRDHIKDKTENDPRNWGVQFLKDLRAISRLKNGNLDQFQVDLRAKVALHEPKHPWCRLADIKELKLDYEHPERLIQVDKEESTEESSEDDYFEELVEPDQPKDPRSDAATTSSTRHALWRSAAKVSRPFWHIMNDPTNVQLFIANHRM
jgi:hypothetical protein